MEVSEKIVSPSEADIFETMEYAPVPESDRSFGHLTNSCDLDIAVGGAKAAQTKWANYSFQETTFNILTLFCRRRRSQMDNNCPFDYCMFHGMSFRW